jgi:muramoyltetrapeptide carboxypeptidase
MYQRLYFLLFLPSLWGANKTFKTPQALQIGDSIGVVAPARKHINDDFSLTKDLLQSWGLHLKIGKSIGTAHHQLSGTDEMRAADLQEMLDNPNIKAIWCARGGYGSVRLLQKLNWDKFMKNPKWLVGFSDVTVLHQKLQALGVASIHAMMPIQMPVASAEAKETLRKALFGEKLRYTIPSSPHNKLGKAEGVLMGGNLSILYSLSGTSVDIQGKDIVLFLEDLDEYLYHIDRMFMQLEHKGLLKSIRGLVVGGMTQMKDNETPWGQDVYQIIQDAMQAYHIPIVYDFPAGHIADNRALIFGQKVVLRVEADSAYLNFDKTKK